MTEEDAKTKFCPMGGRAVSMKDDTLAIGEFTHCIASDCMCWAWDDEYHTTTGIAIPVESTTNGHCGLVNS